MAFSPLDLLVLTRAQDICWAEHAHKHDLSGWRSPVEKYYKWHGVRGGRRTPSVGRFTELACLLFCWDAGGHVLSLEFM